MAQGLAARRAAVVDLMYDAVLEPALWGRVLEELADLTGSAGGLIHGYAIERDAYTFHDLGRIDPDCKRRHEQFHVVNPWQRSALHPVGQLLRSDEMMPLAKLKRTAFYADVLAPQGLAHALTAVLAERPGFKVSINIERSQGKGPYTDREIALMQSMLPHLKRASEIRLRMRDYQEIALAERDTLDLLDIAVVALDHSGDVVVANATATALAFECGLQVKRGHRLGLPRGECADRLRKLVSDTLAGGAGGRIVVNGCDPPIAAQVIAARGRALARHLDTMGSNVAALVTLSCAGCALKAAIPLLSLQHDLTPAETRVAGALADGIPLQATAAALGVSINTLKTHAKSLYAKTSARGQADLIRILANLVPEPSRDEKVRLARQGRAR